jgi:NADH-quinone oxidoreductase subunit G
MTSDKNPNRRGLEWIAKGLGVVIRPFEELLSAIEAGSVKALYAVGGEIPTHPPALEGLLQRLELLIVQAINHGALTTFADLVLPVSPHSEDEGTFTNLDGITQRFRPAYPSRGASQPHWKWAADLGRAAGHAWVPNSAGDVFRETAKRVPELASFDWDGSAPPRQFRPGAGPLPTAADGRPPGYREFGPPRVRGI